MKVIKELAEMMQEELCDAEKYAKCALKWKEEDSRLADMFYNLSKAELEHANLEHEQAVRLIKEYDGEVPAAMQAIYDWEHSKMIEHTSQIKVLLTMYKE